MTPFRIFNRREFFGEFFHDPKNFRPDFFPHDFPARLNVRGIGASEKQRVFLDGLLTHRLKACNREPQATLNGRARN